MYQFVGFPFKDLENTSGLYVSGRLGSGKTLLAVAVSHYLETHWRVQGVTASFPVQWSRACTSWQWCFIIDEIAAAADGRNFKDKNQAKDLYTLIINLRKRGSTLLYTSAIAPDIRVRQLSLRCWRSKAVGSLLWFYIWEYGPESVADQKKDVNYFSGIFALFNPRWLWGRYDTYFFAQPRVVASMVDYASGAWQTGAYHVD